MTKNTLNHIKDHTCPHFVVRVTFIVGFENPIDQLLQNF